MKLNRAARTSWAFTVALACVVAGSTAAAQRAVPRGSSGGGQGSAPAPRPAPAGARAPSPPPSSGTSSDAGSRGGRAASGGDQDSGSPATPYARPRDGRATGTAVSRTSPPPQPGGSGSNIYISPYGYYPWGWGGFGFGGYYGGYYGAYSPWGYGYGYGYRDYSLNYAGDGELRLKVKPNNAQVFVDGYYAGEVDAFDGLFQRLHVEPGPHRIEIRADGYEPLFFDVRVLPNRTVTYSGELTRD